MLEDSTVSSRLFKSTEIDSGLVPRIDFEGSLLRRDSDPTGMLIRTRFYSVEDERAPYSIDTVWAAEFTIPEDASEDSMLGFASTSGVLITWPFARAHIADVVTKMGFPTLLIPTVLVSPVGAPELPAEISENPDAARLESLEE